MVLGLNVRYFFKICIDILNECRINIIIDLSNLSLKQTFVKNGKKTRKKVVHKNVS